MPLFSKQAHQAQMQAIQAQAIQAPKPKQKGPKSCSFCRKNFSFLDNKHYFDTGQVICDSCMSALERRKQDKVVESNLNGHQRWQYRVVTVENTDALNFLGSQGWELISTVSLNQNQNLGLSQSQSQRNSSLQNSIAFIFKRKI